MFQKQSIFRFSPDVNPVDYEVLGILWITDVEELRQCVEEELDRLDQEVIDNAISEWRKRLTANVAAGGGHFEHSL